MACGKGLSQVRASIGAFVRGLLLEVWKLLECEFKFDARHCLAILMNEIQHSFKNTAHLLPSCATSKRMPENTTPNGTAPKTSLAVQYKQKHSPYWFQNCWQELISELNIKRGELDNLS